MKERQDPDRHPERSEPTEQPRRSASLPPGAVGILALQGGFEPHRRTFASLGVETVEVRDPRSLEQVERLVIPGGESTTLARLLRLFELETPLVERVRTGTLSVFGTCAGAILLGRRTARVPHALDLMDVELERNASGPQLHSALHPVRIPCLEHELFGVFIRAPRYTHVGPSVTVLATDRQGTAVAVEAPGLLSATFHPELSGTKGDTCLHRYFLERVAGSAQTPSRRSPPTHSGRLP